MLLNLAILKPFIEQMIDSSINYINLEDDLFYRKGFENGFEKGFENGFKKVSGKSPVF